MEKYLADIVVAGKWGAIPSLRCFVVVYSCKLNLAMMWFIFGIFSSAYQRLNLLLLLF